MPLSASAGAPALPGAERLPELATVHWRPRVTERTLGRDERRWTLSIVSQTVPLIAVAALLAAVSPLMLPVAIVALAHAWTIPELYAARGANVVRRPAATKPLASSSAAERAALRLLGDLLDHRAREFHTRTGLVLERGGFGVWLLSDAGALLIRPGGRQVHCYCVRVTERDLPCCDRVAHLLLALRADEAGFATVANRAFVGARWRLRRRLRGAAREALDYAVITART
jgi:hypothetical protein